MRMYRESERFAEVMATEDDDIIERAARRSDPDAYAGVLASLVDARALMSDPVDIAICVEFERLTVSTTAVPLRIAIAMLFQMTSSLSVWRSGSGDREEMLQYLKGFPQNSILMDDPTP